MSYYKLEELEVYQLSEELSDQIWEIVMQWDHFAKDTVGKQIVRSADSVNANIAEGHGRFHFKENKNFCYFSRGSILETKSFLRKSKNRKLITEEQFNVLMSKLEVVHLKLNSYIKSINLRNSLSKQALDRSNGAS